MSVCDCSSKRLRIRAVDATLFPDEETLFVCFTCDDRLVSYIFNIRFAHYVLRHSIKITRMTPNEIWH